MTTSKSPRRVLRVAYDAAREAVPTYSHVNRPHKFTQPQLLACLLLKEFLCLDYRGLAAHLADHPELIRLIDLKAVPHYTTFQKAADRLLVAAPARELFDAVLDRAVRDKLPKRRVRLAAVDGTGLESRHVSRYYVKRRSKDRTGTQETTYSKYPKVVLVTDCHTHLVLAAVPGRGPGSDLRQFQAAVKEAVGRARIGTLLADPDYDAEWVHEHVRGSSIRALIPPERGRPSDKPPAGKWRRRMRQRFDETKYAQKWQTETVNSMIKRRLGSALRARGYWSQCREIILRVVTHNVMIVARVRVFYRAPVSAFSLAIRSRTPVENGRYQLFSLAIRSGTPVESATLGRGRCERPARSKCSGGLMRYVRTNDLWAAGSGPPGQPDLAPALGTWFNCNRDTGEIVRLELAARDGALVLRAFGAGEPAGIDWGETPTVPHVSSLSSREVAGFTARYDFGFMETQIAANLKYGVLVIQSYNRFRDDSGRPCYFTREFFHQDRAAAPPASPPPPAGAAAELPHRMASDRPAVAPGPGGGIVDLSPWLGRWHNTNRDSKGIRSVVLSRRGDEFFVHAAGVGCDADWGAVPAIPHAAGVSSATPEGFLARYDFGFSEVLLSANVAKGLLIIASFATFRDGSGRSSYFTREFFHRELAGTESPP